MNIILKKKTHLRTYLLTAPGVLTRSELLISKQCRITWLLMEFEWKIPVILFQIRFTAVYSGYHDETDNRTHVKEIPNTKLLVSLHHAYNLGANLEIYDISQKSRPRKIYSFEEVKGGKFRFFLIYWNYHFDLVTGTGDVTYNSRRNILGAISVDRSISYNLFNLDINSPDKVAKLCRKSQWRIHYSTSLSSISH